MITKMARKVNEIDLSPILRNPEIKMVTEIFVYLF